MPKLSSWRRLITNDFPKEDRKLVEQISSPINDSFNELYFATNGRLSVSENLYCTVRTIDVIVDATGVPLATTSFTLTHAVPVLGVQVIYAANQDNSSNYPSAQPFVSFTAISGGILINHISGLTANERYTIRLIAWH